MCATHFKKIIEWIFEYVELHFLAARDYYDHFQHFFAIDHYIHNTSEYKKKPEIWVLSWYKFIYLHRLLSIALTSNTLWTTSRQDSSITKIYLVFLLSTTFIENCLGVPGRSFISLQPVSMSNIIALYSGNHPSIFNEISQPTVSLVLKYDLISFHFIRNLSL